VFTDLAFFAGAEFTDEAEFTWGAQFTRLAFFTDATFASSTDFSGTVFTGPALFARARRKIETAPGMWLAVRSP
jgi:hypothetical protein